MSSRHDQGPFGIWWFGYAVLSIVTLTVIALGVLTVVDGRYQAEAAQAEAAHYTPPPLQYTSSAEKSVTVFGDSYSTATGASAPANGFVNLVAQTEGWQVANEAHGGTGYVNQGISTTCGPSACPNYDQSVAAATAGSPSIVLVSGGRNDVVEPEDALGPGIKKFFTDLRAKYPKAKIYATSPIWDSTDPPAELGVVAGFVQADVKRVGGTYLDIGEPLKGHRDWLISDGVHPNDQGHAAIAKAVEKALPKG